MQEWKPITLIELYSEIQKTENDLNGELWNFWQLIRIEPTKWEEKNYGKLGGGFWVVAICGTQIIWYNDIEEGFNISTYQIYGSIKEYYCNQDEISFAVIQLFDLIKFGVDIGGKSSPPINLW